MIVERKDAVWCIEFSGVDLQKLDQLVNLRGTNRLEVIVHALNLCGEEQRSFTATVQPEPVKFANPLL